MGTSQIIPRTLILCTIANTIEKIRRNKMLGIKNGPVQKTYSYINWEKAVVLEFGGVL